MIRKSGNRFSLATNAKALQKCPISPCGSAAVREVGELSSCTRPPSFRSCEEMPLNVIGLKAELALGKAGCGGNWNYQSSKPHIHRVADRRAYGIAAGGGGVCEGG